MSGSAEVEAWRLGITMFDVYVAILNSARFELSTSDDSTGLPGWNCLGNCSEDGKYIVQIRDSSYGGNGALSIGRISEHSRVRWGPCLPVENRARLLKSNSWEM